MRILLAVLMITAAAAAHAQSSGGGGRSGGSMGSGGSSGAAKTEQAPSGTLRTGPNQVIPGDTTSPPLGAPGSGIAPGSSGRGSQQALVPDLCKGPVNDPACAGSGDPTGTGLGDRGIGQGAKDRYGPEDSPVKGGPPFEGPTGRPLDLPREGR